MTLQELARTCALALSLASGAAAAQSADPPGADKGPAARDSSGGSPLQTRRFGTVMLYRPAGTPQSVAIFLSADGGWHLGVINMAKALAANGAVVIGVDVTR